MNIPQRYYFPLGVGILFVLVYFGYATYSKQESVDSIVATTTEQGQATTTSKPTTQPKPSQGSKTPMYSYSNATYGFQMKYPTYVKAENWFSVFHALGNNWRLYAPQQAQGKALVSFIVFRTDQGTIAEGKSYPLFFSSEVRVGVSPNTAECYTPDAGFTNQKISNVTINGVAFKKFDFSDAGMQQYVRGSSYRTIYKNQCYVIEQIRNASSYKDETMKPGIAESTLDGYDAIAESIVKTFVFTK